MFLNQELKKIQDAKNRLAICCDLHRQLVHLEIHGIRNGVVKTGSKLTTVLAIIEQILGFLRERKGNRS